MKKILITLHRWLGFPLGILFILTFATGCLTAIDELLIRIEQSNENSQFIWKRSTLEQNAQAIEYFTLQHTGIRQIQIPSKEKPYYRVIGKQENWTYTIDFLDSEEPIEGIHQKKEKGGFFDTVLNLHRNLLLGKEGFLGLEGKYYVVWVGLISLLISLLGLWLWWPRKNTFKSKDILPRGKKRKNFYLSHMTSGVIVLIAILLLSLTGASITYRSFAQQLFGIEKDSKVTIKPIQLEKSWTSWIIGAYQVMPEGAKLQEIRFPRVRRNADKVDTTVNERAKDKPKSKPTVKTKVRSKEGGNIRKADKRIEFNFQHQDDWFEIKRSKAYITQRKSELVDVILYSDLPLKDKVYSLLKPLHTGHDLPVYYVIILLLFSIIGTTMALSCVVSFAIKKRKYKKIRAYFNHLKSYKPSTTK
jgi:uncharacterized iron-regulated membrane protein